MSDLSKSSEETPGASGLWPIIKKAANRLQDWFVIQTIATKLAVLFIVVLIPATGTYSVMLLKKHAGVAEQVKNMSASGEGIWTLNDKLPGLFGAGSMLSFLETNPDVCNTEIYRPLSWSVSERIVLIESQGKQYA